MKVTYQGIEVELKLRPGFTVHNQDGTAYKLMYVDSVVVPPLPPGPGGPGEPLPIRDAA